MNTEEIWKDVPGYEGLYQCSNLGRVKSLGNKKGKKEKILKLHLGINSYKRIALTKDKKANFLTVHKVVAITFLNHNPKERNLIVDHIDGIKTNNKVENLRLLVNRKNKLKFNTKDYKVYFNNSSIRFQAYMLIDKKYIYLGSFKNRIDAENECIEKFNSIKVENI